METDADDHNRVGEQFSKATSGRCHASSVRDVEQQAHLETGASVPGAAASARVQMALDGLLEQRDLTPPQASQFDAAIASRIEAAVASADFTNVPVPDFTAVTPDLDAVVSRVAPDGSVRPVDQPRP